MKILHVTSHAGTGGDWQIIKHLTDCLRGRGISVEICGAAVTGRDDGAIELPLNRGFNGIIISVMRFPKGRLPDIFHAHSTAGIIFCIMLCVYNLSVRPIIYTHHIHYNNREFKRILKFILFRIVSHINVISSSCARKFAAEYLFHFNDLKLILIGINENRIFPRDEHIFPRYREQLKIRDEEFVFGFIGRIDTEKNVESLVGAFSEIYGHDAYLLIAGDGPLRQQLDMMVSKNGMAGRVAFVGHISDVGNFYRSIDCLVLPSERETFGLVVVEAAFFGVPTLRTNLPGASDQIIDGWSGYICEPDQKSIREGLSRVLGDRANVKSIGINARQSMRVKFDSARMTDDFIALYKNSLAK